MKEPITEKIKRFWAKWQKHIIAALVLVALIATPESFLIYNLDIAFRLILAVGGLLLLRFAKSTYDEWQSRPNIKRRVSISKFMAESDNDLAKGIVHASQIIALAVIIAAAISAG